MSANLIQPGKEGYLQLFTCFPIGFIVYFSFLVLNFHVGQTSHGRNLIMNSKLSIALTQRIVTLSWWANFRLEY